MGQSRLASCATGQANPTGYAMGQANLIPTGYIIYATGQANPAL